MTCFELKQVVKKSGMKIKGLAEHIGVSAYTLGAYLNGKRGLSYSAKVLLYQKLNLDTGALLKHAS